MTKKNEIVDFMPLLSIEIKNKLDFYYKGHQDNPLRDIG